MSLIRGDAIAIPLRDESVDLIVTSPPYFALRSYTDDGEHYDGQIGSEPTPQDFLEALWAVTAECRRVLKPSGSMWVNLGDKYAGSAGWCNSEASAASSTLQDKGRQQRQAAGRKPQAPKSDVRAKSLMGLPWRYAIGCIDDLDLILRAEVIWSKPNGLPESVTDRVRRSHEQWFMFTKEPRYFAAVDEIRESRSGDVVEPPPQHLPGCPLFGGPVDPLATSGVGGRHEAVPGVQRLDLADQERANQRVQDEHVARSEQEHQIRSGGSPVPLLVGAHANLGADGTHLVDDGLVAAVDGEAKMRALGAAVAEGDGTLAVDDSGQPRKVCTCGHATYHSASLGKLPGSVWTVPSEPLKVPDWLGVDHFAAFPQEWPRRIILGWSPSGICVECGQGRRPVVEKALEHVNHSALKSATADGGAARAMTNVKNVARESATITGYACDCDQPTAPTRPAVVLDPFGGTGTTAMVARALGRYPVHIDLSADYLRLARWRIYESGHASKTAERTNRERQGVLL